MHIPKPFEFNEPEQIYQFIQDNAFADFVTTGDDGLPIATPLPFLIKRENVQITLQAHFAKSNPHWKQIANNQKALVIFNGPHCYISPSWYENEGVPTWDYITVHAIGTVRLFQSPDQTRELIEELTDKYESKMAFPWKPSNNYPDKMLNAIIGFEIKVQEFNGKVKIGQNKSEGDLKGVIKALRSSSSENDRAIAKLINKHLQSKE